MTNIEKYNNAFINGLSIPKDTLTESLCYQDITQWDSIGHMSLVSELEDSFDIMLDTEDIIDFNSYKIGKEILSKYNIKLS